MAAIIVPVATSICLGLAHVLGVPDGDLSDLPTPMIVLWGPVIAAIVASPVAFMLGAWAARRTQKHLTAAARPRTSLVRQCVVFVAVGGAIWGAVLGTAGALGWQVGWVLVPVGAIAGAIGGRSVAWLVLSDRKDSVSSRRS